MIDRADAASRSGSASLSRLLRERVKAWDAIDGAWERMDMSEQMPRRTDGAEICACDAETRVCGCEPLKPQRRDATIMDPVEQAKRERDARNKAAAGTNTARNDSAEERARIEEEIAHERRRQAFRDSQIAERAARARSTR